MVRRRSHRLVVLVPAAMALVIAAGCQTTARSAASQSAPLVRSPQAANVRVEFWSGQIRDLTLSLGNIERQGERFRAERPGSPEPITYQVQRDQTVALLLRARTELQDAQLDRALPR